ncbi:hypothetical protein C0585_01325 [Candidatus Woesearchaeota archaeon]|nr:MAG: hypothetical protein C0585_01325 [Candidatus Woesearchaeota archaeon]
MKNRLLYNLTLLSKKPKIMPRVLKNYFLILIGKKRLRSVEVDLGYECQLNCDHCYAAEAKNTKRKYISFNEMKDAIDQAIDQGAIHFLISGGEPLLYHQVFDLIKYINKKNAFSCLVTNGVNLNEKVIGKLKDSKLDVLEISLDSSDPKKHDSNRYKKGLFNNIIKSIKKLEGSKIIIFTSSVFTNENITDGDAEKIISLGKELKIESHFCFPIAMGNWKGKNVLLTKKNIKKASELLKKNNIRSCEEGNYLKSGCSAGVEKICINPYGDVTPCPYIQETYGNITELKLSKILELMRENKFYKKIDGPCMPAFNKDFIKTNMKNINNSKEKPYNPNSKRFL